MEFFYYRLVRYIFYKGSEGIFQRIKLPIVFIATGKFFNHDQVVLFEHVYAAGSSGCIVVRSPLKMYHIYRIKLTFNIYPNVIYVLSIDTRIPAITFLSEKIPECLATEIQIGIPKLFIQHFLCRH